MRKGRALGAGALVVALTCAGGLWWWGHADRTFAAPVTTPSPVSNPTEAVAAAGALGQLETDPSVLLPAELVGELGDTATQAVPTGTEVSADPSTWVPSSVGGGVIEAQLDYPDGTTERVAVVMVVEPDGWKVLQTIPLDVAP